MEMLIVARFVCSLLLLTARFAHVMVYRSSQAWEEVACKRRLRECPNSSTLTVFN